MMNGLIEQKVSHITIVHIYYTKYVTHITEKNDGYKVYLGS